MPCRVDLFEGYKWYDCYDLADHMYFNTPLVPLMCELMKLIEDKKLMGECSDTVQKWYKYHQEDDISKEITGKRIRYSDKQEELEVFVKHMRDIGFLVTTGILTDEQKKYKEEQWQKQEEENRIFMEKVHQEKEELLKEIIKEKKQKEKLINDNIIESVGYLPNNQELQNRMNIEYETITGTTKVISIYYWDSKEIFRIEN